MVKNTLESKEVRAVKSVASRGGEVCGEVEEVATVTCTVCACCVHVALQCAPKKTREKWTKQIQKTVQKVEEVKDGVEEIYKAKIRDKYPKLAKWYANSSLTINVMSVYVDLYSDVGAITKFYEDGFYWWGILMLVFVLLPFVAAIWYIAYYFLQNTKAEQRGQVWRWLPVLIVLGPLFDLFFVPCYFASYHMKDEQKKINAQAFLDSYNKIRTVSEAVLESFPQTILQGTFGYLHGGLNSWELFFSFMFSCINLAKNLFGIYIAADDENIGVYEYSKRIIQNFGGLPVLQITNGKSPSYLDLSHRSELTLPLQLQLAKAFEKNTTTEHVDLTGLGFGPEGAKKLAQSLQEAPKRKLASLNLTNNRVGDGGAMALIKSGNLRTLILNANSSSTALEEENARADARRRKRKIAPIDLTKLDKQLKWEMDHGMYHARRQHERIEYLSRRHGEHVQRRVELRNALKAKKTSLSVKQVFRRVKCFAALNQQEDGLGIMAVLNSSVLKRYKSGGVVYRHGDCSRALAIVIRGSVMLSITKQTGGEIVEEFEICKEADVFGERALWSDKSAKRTDTAVVCEDSTEILFLDRSHFTALCAEKVVNEEKIIAVLRQTIHTPTQSRAKPASRPTTHELEKLTRSVDSLLDDHEKETVVAKLLSKDKHEEHRKALMKRQKEYQTILREHSNLLEHIDLFNGLRDKGAVKYLIKCLSIETFDKDEIICKQGEASKKFYIIMKGLVAVYVKTKQEEDSDREKTENENGEESDENSFRMGKLVRQIHGIEENNDRIVTKCLKHTIHKSDTMKNTLRHKPYFGETACMNGATKRRTATCVAREACTLLCLSRRQYLEFSSRKFLKSSGSAGKSFRTRLDSKVKNRALRKNLTIEDVETFENDYNIGNRTAKELARVIQDGTNTLEYIDFGKNDEINSNGIKLIADALREVKKNGTFVHLHKVVFARFPLPVKYLCDDEKPFSYANMVLYDSIKYAQEDTLKWHNKLHPKWRATSDKILEENDLQFILHLLTCKREIDLSGIDLNFSLGDGADQAAAREVVAKRIGEWLFEQMETISTHPKLKIDQIVLPEKLLEEADKNDEGKLGPLKILVEHGCIRRIGLENAKISFKQCCSLGKLFASKKSKIVEWVRVRTFKDPSIILNISHFRDKEVQHLLLPDDFYCNEANVHDCIAIDISDSTKGEDAHCSKWSTFDLNHFAIIASMLIAGENGDLKAMDFHIEHLHIDEDSFIDGVSKEALFGSLVKRILDKNKSVEILDLSHTHANYDVIAEITQTTNNNLKDVNLSFNDDLDSKSLQLLLEFISRPGRSFEKFRLVMEHDIHLTPSDWTAFAKTIEENKTHLRLGPGSLELDWTKFDIVGAGSLVGANHPCLPSNDIRFDNRLSGSADHRSEEAERFYAALQENSYIHSVMVNGQTLDIYQLKNCKAYTRTNHSRKPLLGGSYFMSKADISGDDSFLVTARMYLLAHNVHLNEIAFGSELNSDQKLHFFGMIYFLGVHKRAHSLGLEKLESLYIDFDLCDDDMVSKIFATEHPAINRQPLVIKEPETLPEKTAEIYAKWLSSGGGEKQISFRNDVEGWKTMNLAALGKFYEVNADTNALPTTVQVNRLGKTFEERPSIDDVHSLCNSLKLNKVITLVTYDMKKLGLDRVCALYENNIRGLECLDLRSIPAFSDEDIQSLEKMLKGCDETMKNTMKVSWKSFQLKQIAQLLQQNHQMFPPNNTIDLTQLTIDQLNTADLHVFAAALMKNKNVKVIHFSLEQFNCSQLAIIYGTQHPSLPKKLDLREKILDEESAAVFATCLQLGHGVLDQLQINWKTIEKKSIYKVCVSLYKTKHKALPQSLDLSDFPAPNNERGNDEADRFFECLKQNEHLEFVKLNLGAFTFSTNGKTVSTKSYGIEKVSELIMMGIPSLKSIEMGLNNSDDYLVIKHKYSDAYKQMTKEVAQSKYLEEIDGIDIRQLRTQRHVRICKSRMTEATETCVSLEFDLSADFLLIQEALQQNKTLETIDLSDFHLIGKPIHSHVYRFLKGIITHCPQLHHIHMVNTFLPMLTTLRITEDILNRKASSHEPFILDIHRDMSKNKSAATSDEQTKWDKYKRFCEGSMGGFKSGGHVQPEIRGFQLLYKSNLESLKLDLQLDVRGCFADTSNKEYQSNVSMFKPGHWKQRNINLILDDEDFESNNVQRIEYGPHESLYTI